MQLLFIIVSLCLLSGCTAQKKPVWMYTSIYKAMVEDLSLSLKKEFPDVNAQWFQAGSEIIASKIEAEFASGRPQADLILTGDPFWYYEMKKKGRFLTYKPQLKNKIPEMFLDHSWDFQMNRLTFMAIVYNPQKISASDAPKSWQDLTKPRFKDKIAMSSPLESGSTFTSVAQLYKRYGWAYFEKLKDNHIMVAGGHSNVLNRLESGERPVGIFLIENALNAKHSGIPLEIVYPDDGVIAIPCPIAIMKTTQNEEIAKRLYDWFYSEDFQNAVVKSGGYSIFPDFPAPQGAKRFTELEKTMFKWSPSLLESLYSERDAIKSKFSQVFFKD